MEEIRLATIGSGMIVHAILDRVEMVKGIRCVAVYSRSRETGEKLADSYGVKKVYTDIGEMLQDEEINFVYVASPNSFHYEHVKKALLAGKNVICEKPFCTKAAQAAELTALAKKEKLFLIDAVPTTFLPNFEVLKRELPKVGRIRLVLNNYSQYSSRYDQVLKGSVPNIFSLEFAGGCLMDINVYNVYLNVALFGRPKQAVYYPNVYENLADTSGIMIMQYEDFVSQCAGAKDTWGINSVQIQGEKGYIYIKDGSNGLAEIKVVTKTTEEIFNEHQNHDRLFYEVQRITRLVLDDDYDAFYQRLGIMQDVVDVIETARKNAGIMFPGD